MMNLDSLRAQYGVLDRSDSSSDINPVVWEAK